MTVVPLGPSPSRMKPRVRAPWPPPAKYMEQIAAQMEKIPRAWLRFPLQALGRGQRPNASWAIIRQRFWRTGPHGNSEKEKRRCHRHPRGMAELTCSSTLWCGWARSAAIYGRRKTDKRSPDPTLPYWARPPRGAGSTVASARSRWRTFRTTRPKSDPFFPGNQTWALNSPAGPGNVTLALVSSLACYSDQAASANRRARPKQARLPVLKWQIGTWEAGPTTPISPAVLSPGSVL